MDTQKKRAKCPNGTRKNKITGECEKIEVKPKSKKTKKNRISNEEVSEKEEKVNEDVVNEDVE